jgi:hypothetical protein
MQRSKVNEAFLSLFDAPSYLEIGVWKGETFHAVEADHKTAVDPRFAFDVGTARRENSNAEYFEMTSNAYFAGPGGNAKFDVIFLDGLHTFEQTLMDLLNAVPRVKDRGIIIIDDVIPDSYPSSLRQQSDSSFFRSKTGDLSQAWMGDVFRLVFFIEAFMLPYSFCTVAENHGQLIMWRQPREKSRIPDASVEWVSRRDFLDVKKFYELFNICPLAEILNRARIRNLG